VIQTSFLVTQTDSGDIGAYDFSAPMDMRAWGLDDPFFMDIVSTEAFQRLHSVRFLGGIDYSLVQSPNGAWGNIRYTRFQHSLGVARLSLMYGRSCELDESDTRLIFSAALLHDVGHAPLSHSLEPVFNEIFGIEHHRATEDIVTGRVPIGRSLFEVLRRHGVNIDRVIALMSGIDTSFHEFFSGPINFDTIEGILRTRAYTKPAISPLAPELVVAAAMNRSTTADQEIVDQFWRYKDQIYRHVINSKAGILADLACQIFMRHHVNDLSPEDYFSTEENIFNKLPGLRSLLTNPNFESLLTKYIGRTVSYKVRRFFVDQEGNFLLRDDKSRYRQTRTTSTVEIRLPDSTDASSTEDLFGDQSD
jgi:uncharacterized protein